MTKVIELQHLSDLYPDPPIPLSRDIFYMFPANEVHPLLAHVCTFQGKRTPAWIWQGTRLHRTISREPLHLENSIGWQECCGRHGWIRGGAWEPAGDDFGFTP